jgi:hypothetical protein
MHSSDRSSRREFLRLAGFVSGVAGLAQRHGSYGKGFYVVLNRGVVTVQKEDATGHVIR